MMKLMLFYLFLLIISCRLTADPVARRVLDTGYSPQNPDISVSSDGRIGAVFESMRGLSVKEIFFTVSTDSGSTWAAPIIISANDSKAAGLARIAAYNTEFHAVWQEKPANANEIYYSRYSGGVWSTPILISTSDGIASQSPDIAVYKGAGASGTVCIVWQDLADGNFEIYKTSFPTNADLSAFNYPPVNLTARDASDSIAPSIAADLTANNFFVSWVDNRNGHPEIYYRSTAGAVITETMVSSDDSTNSQSPSLAVSNSGVQMVWEDYKYFGLNYTDIFARNYSINGAAGQKEELVKNASISKAPSITSDILGDFHLVWQDQRSGNYEIYYSKKETQGWSSQIRLTSSSENAERPAAVATPYSGESGSGVYIIWQEQLNLYYLHLPAGGVSPDTPQVSEVFPENNAIDVSTTVIPSALYNKELESSTVTAANVKLLEDVSGTAVNGTVSLSSDGKKITFYPQAALSYNLKYRFELSPAITDKSGNLSVGYIVHFTTQAQGTPVPDQGIKLSQVKLYRQGKNVGFQYQLSFNASDSVGSVSIKVYSSGGKLIKKIENADYSGVNCNTVWDGKSRFGDSLSNGVYFYTITAKTVSGKKDEIKGKFLITD